MMEEWTKLALGADVVQMLLPHRRPFLLVDGIDAIVLSPRPMLRAHKMVSANEPVFEGVASKGTGVFETLKGVAKLVLQELTKTG